MAAVLAVLEQRDGHLKKIAHEVLTAARTLADQNGAEVHAVVIGPEGMDLASAGVYGADQTIVVASDDLVLYQPNAYCTAVTDILTSGDYGVVVLGATSLGKDLGPRIAARSDCPLAADVIAIGFNEHLTVKRSVYSGKAIATLKVERLPVVISIRPNVFTASEAARTPAVTSRNVPSPAAHAGRTVEVKEPETARPDVGEASVVISGGRGLKEPANFKLVEDLADAFGSAAVGASRAVVDAGWRSHADQVGQTGKTVSPQLYIAVGISGAVQHLAGMRTSKVIVAINKDRDAPIFKVADYGIVGDLFEVVPKLTEAVKRARGA